MYGYASPYVFLGHDQFGAVPSMCPHSPCQVKPPCWITASSSKAQPGDMRLSCRAWKTPLEIDEQLFARLVRLKTLGCHIVKDDELLWSLQTVGVDTARPGSWLIVFQAKTNPTS